MDRCGKHFGTVLNYLRDGSVTLPDTARELAELYTEAKYYCIQELGKYMFMHMYTYHSPV